MPPPPNDLFRAVWTTAWFIGLIFIGDATYYVLMGTSEGQCGDIRRVAGDQLDHFCNALGIPLHGIGCPWSLV